MAIPSARKPVFVWIVLSIAVALVVVLYLVMRRPVAPRRALYLVGNAEKGAALFYGDKQCGICQSQRCGPSDHLRVTFHQLARIYVPNRTAARALARAASSSRFLGGAWVSSERMRRLEA